MTPAQKKTTEALDKLEKALKAGQYNYTVNNLHANVASDADLDRMESEAGAMAIACSHEWVEYVGLHECYSYCKRCDIKATSDKK